MGSTGNGRREIADSTQRKLTRKLVKEIVLVQAAVTKISQAGRLKQQKFLTVLDAGSLRSGANSSVCWGGPSSWLVVGCFLPVAHVARAVSSVFCPLERHQSHHGAPPS